MTYKVIEIPKEYKYVSQYFKEDLPDNAYIDKVLCGCGATTFVLTNNIPYVVAIPFQSLGDNKLIQSIDNEEYPYELFVYHSGIEQVKVKLSTYLTRIQEKGHPAKILVTYDSLPKLSSHLDFEDYKLFIDEGHKVLEYMGNFKPKVIKDMLDLIPKFRAFVTVTATPTRESFIPVEFQPYDKIKLQWASTTQVQFNHCKLYPNQLKEVILSLCLRYLRQEEDGNVYIFINSVSKCVSFIKTLVKQYHYTEKDIKIICADTSDNKKILKTLGKNWKPKRVIEPNETDFYRVNFITSTAFEGQDFLDPEGKTVIISDSSLEHTKLDISTQVSQIVGRLRVSKYKHKVDMYWTESPTLSYTSEDDYMSYLEEENKNAQRYIEIFNSSKDNRMASLALIEKATVNPFFIDVSEGEDLDLIVNPNAINHLMNNFVGTSLQYFVNTDSDITVEEKVEYNLRQVFSGSIENNLELPRLSVKDKRKLGRKSNYGKTARAFIDTIKQARFILDPEDKKILNDWLEEFESDLNNETLVSYVKIFGLDSLDHLEDSSITEARLEKKVFEFYQKEHFFTVLKSSFKTGSFYSNSELKDLIQGLCDQHKIDIKAKASDINIAFNTKKVNRIIKGVKQHGLELESKKYKYNVKL